MFLFGDAEKLCPQRDLGGQVKPMAHQGADSLAQPAFRPAVGVDDLPTELGPLGSHHQLLGRSLGRREPSAQAFMTGHHIAQRGPQRIDVEAPAQPQRDRHVVDR